MARKQVTTKKPASSTTSTTTTTTTTPSTSSSAQNPKTHPLKQGSNKSIYDVLLKLLNDYLDTASAKTRLIDTFMVFLVFLGVFQFLVVLVIGTYPFNAFLGGFASTVGQFVLLANLRIQTTKSNASQFPSVTPERAFGDFVVGSLFLHFMVYHFIN